jgi:hypothetical protein
MVSFKVFERLRKDAEVRDPGLGIPNNVSGTANEEHSGRGSAALSIYITMKESIHER